MLSVTRRAVCAGVKRGVRAYHVPRKEMQFQIDEVWRFQEHYKGLKRTNGESATPEMVGMVLEEVGKFAENVLAPLNSVADKVGCKYVNEHEVQTPPGFKDAYQQWVQGGWQGLSFPSKFGGQGLPSSLALWRSEITASANFTWTMYPGLSQGAINTILGHASADLQNIYLPRLISGEWTGTMCLTEPHCGSDLSQVRTKAEPNGDGTYKITGTKIFISCGEHDMADNIVHCVLARLPGAPEGTRGISLFLVPKRTLLPSGEPGPFNGANIGRIEEKMGCHGSSTCEINFEKAKGWLIGEANKGLNHMFTFINTSRLGTAIQGVTAAEVSYQNALAYAKERLAMRSLTGPKNPSGPADPIICHPDVRKMLLTQKCIAEGGRSMIYECAQLADKMEEAKAAGDDKLRKKIDERLAFLTPILKGFLTERGVEAANLGIQIWGGHGYIKENKQEQILRDVRISAVWEGTTGIQALDLLGRKIMLQKLAPINEHCFALYKYAWGVLSSGEGGKLRSHAATLLRHAIEWHYLTYRIAAKAASNKDAIGVASVDYLMYSGYVSLAYHWLKMEEAAVKGLKKGGDKDFYNSKIQTSHFYYENVLPRTRTLVNTMLAPVDSVMGLKPENFAF